MFLLYSKLILLKDLLDELADVVDSPDDVQFLYQNDTLQHERSRLRTVFVDVKRQLTMEAKKLDEYEQINKSKSVLYGDALSD